MIIEIALGIVLGAVFLYLGLGFLGFCAGVAEAIRDWRAYRRELRVAKYRERMGRRQRWTEGQKDMIAFAWACGGWLVIASPIILAAMLH